MVARGAGAAGPVLLACRQWDPLGLARWLPSLGAGAWRSAPPLPWRVQCPVRVCAALAAGSGGSGRYLVLCLPRFHLPAPRVPRCVWRVVLSGCPLPSPAGTPFHAVCAFRELGPVALLVVPACLLCVCALALPRCPLPPPPPPLGGVARPPRAVLALGAGRAVPHGPCPSACPAPVPCSVWRALGGGQPGPVSPLPGLGLCSPRGVGLRARGVPVPGGWVGGGGGLCPAPCVCAASGGKPGGGSLCVVPSLCLPWAGNKAGVTGVVLVMEGVAPIPLRFVLACRLWARSAWRPGALVRARLFPAVPVGAGGWGGGAGLPPAPLSGAAVPPGGGGTIPSALGGWGLAPPRLAGRPGRWGGGRAAAPLLSLWGAARVSLPCPPSRRRRIPPRRARSVGVAGPPRAWVRPAWRGGGWREGRPVNRSPGGPVRLKPSLRPPRVGNIAGVTGDALVMGGAAPILFWFVAACRPRAWSARRSGALVRARPSAATPAGAGGGGRWGARLRGPAASPPP